MCNSHLNFKISNKFRTTLWSDFQKTASAFLELKKNVIASCEDWTHDPWFTRPVLCHWAKEAVALMVQ